LRSQTRIPLWVSGVLPGNVHDTASPGRIGLIA
jgi:hypothetical protein